MFPAASAEARGEVGEGERERRWLSRVVCGVREVSISCTYAERGWWRQQGSIKSNQIKSNQEEEEGQGFGERSPYGISALLVLPRDAAREPRRQEHGYGLRRLHREQERGIPVGILADALVFVARVNEELLQPIIVISSSTLL